MDLNKRKARSAHPTKFLPQDSILANEAVATRTMTPPTRSELPAKPNPTHQSVLLRRMSLSDEREGGKKLGGEHEEGRAKSGWTVYSDNSPINRATHLAWSLAKCVARPGKLD